MKIISASHRGMCFGVKEAVARAMKLAAQQGKITILGDLVHNEAVHAALSAGSIHLRRNGEDILTATVMTSAHGASNKTLRKIQKNGHHVVEATCPLVRFVHRTLSQLVRDGYHPVIIGKSDHVEVRGMTEDLAEYDVVISEQDVMQLKERPRFGVVSQTTQPVGRVQHLAAMIRSKFPRAEVLFKDTVCRPTKLRLSTAEEMAEKADAMVVVGSLHSNNTCELAAACRRHCGKVFQIQSPSQLQDDWFEDTHTVGVTAGTSTPDEIIDAVERQLAAWSNPIFTGP